MKLSLNNFLYGIKQLVTGGGVEKDGVTPALDSGYLHDMNFSLMDFTFPLTDSSGGTASQTIAANSFKSTVIIPIQDADLVNAQTWKINMPFAGSVTTAGVRTGKPGTGASATATLTTQINGTPTTGGVITMTLASQATTGVLTAGTAITALNTFTAGQTLEFAVSGVTSFTAGDAYIEFTVSNTDLANAAASLASTLNLVSAETNLKVVKAFAGGTAVGSITFVLPRDYDENTDTLALHIGVAMSGSTDTPTLSATAYRKRPGSSIATIDSSVAGKLRDGTTATLSSTEQVVIFNFSRKTLLMDDAITIVITSTAHTTDDILLYYVEPVYRSTLVSYHESFGTNARDGKSGTFLR